VSLRDHASWRACAISVALIAALGWLGAAGQPPVRGGTPSAAEVATALEAVGRDPNVTNEQTIRTLKWRDGKAPSLKTDARWWRWIAGLFAWFTRSTRYVLWVTAVVLAGLLVIYIGRSLGRYDELSGEDDFMAPTHVRELDIRPESLPPDIGAAARRLWDGDQRRAALALLYRGLLSRLAHIHRIPIRESTTEGDCLALTGDRAAPPVRDYAARLIPVWQQFVYGARGTPTFVVHGLCDAFAPSLDAGDAIGVADGEERA
jgi:hypothetical protein